MATSFKGWGNSWGNSWGPISADPNAMSGGAGISLTATATATAALFGEGAAGFSFGATGTLSAGAPPSGDMAGFANFTFSAIGILTDPNAYPDRRPKSTNTLKLRRIAEGKAWLVGSRTVTRANPVRANGYAPEIVVHPVFPGRATTLSGSCKSKSNNVRATGATRVTTLRSVSDTCAWRVTAIGVAKSALKSSTTDSAAHTVLSSGGAASGLLSGYASSVTERVLARGTNRLSDTDIVVIAKMLTARDKVVY
jgi:hypothetical protein